MIAILNEIDLRGQIQGKEGKKKWASDSSLKGTNDVIYTRYKPCNVRVKISATSAHHLTECTEDPCWVSSKVHLDQRPFPHSGQTDASGKPTSNRHSEVDLPHSGMWRSSSKFTATHPRFLRRNRTTQDRINILTNQLFPLCSTTCHKIRQLWEAMVFQKQYILISPLSNISPQATFDRWMVPPV